MSLTDEIRGRAQDLGFDLVGAVPAGPLDSAWRYAAWLARGFHGRMEYLERNPEKRADPRLLLPGARSVLCLGMRYFQEPGPTGDPCRGRVSCYALGEDYHDLIEARLVLLADFVRERAGKPVQARTYVDTGPLLERELARAAGLGWQGKNTCLINQELGSYFFLAEIIMDLELEYDQPAADRCGRCTRCQNACPTQALPEPRVLDARRCISYLTIELKGPIPRELRPGLGNWIFGCDLCQQVCPWNRRAAPAPEPGFRAQAGLEAPELVGLLAMDEDEFRRRFRNSPVKRAKRRGFLRNVAVALGNSGERAVVPDLARALKDVEPLVRGHAAWALGRLGGEQAQRALAAALQGEADPYVREEVELART